MQMVATLVQLMLQSAQNDYRDVALLVEKEAKAGASKGFGAAKKE
jgi:hypothetical protein